MFISVNINQIQYIFFYFTTYLIENMSIIYFIFKSFESRIFRNGITSSSIAEISLISKETEHLNTHVTPKNISRSYGK